MFFSPTLMMMVNFKNMMPLYLKHVFFCWSVPGTAEWHRFGTGTNQKHKTQKSKVCRCPSSTEVWCYENTAQHHHCIFSNYSL